MYYSRIYSRCNILDWLLEVYSCLSETVWWKQHSAMGKARPSQPSHRDICKCTISHAECKTVSLIYTSTLPIASLGCCIYYRFGCSTCTTTIFQQQCFSPGSKMIRGLMCSTLKLLLLLTPIQAQTCSQRVTGKQIVFYLTTPQAIIFLHD